ncbi:hypothetical protein BD413DRAFT_497075 [Trametes elegans]|nr:hypothetical protein BD413DRAFT_497075 [Trametes elegans]
MLTLRCKICLEVMDSSSTPMSTQCGHIYCLDCATFHFAQGDPFCAVCRKPQTLDTMIRLYADSDEGTTRDDAHGMSEADELSSSPISVRSIERAGQDAVNTVKQAIAGKEDMKDALLACNTFVNCVPPRERPHINEDLLREMLFQLTLVQTVLKDNEERVTRLKEELQQVRAAETSARVQIEERRRAARHAERQYATAIKELKALQGRYENLYQNYLTSTEDYTKLGVRNAQLKTALEDKTAEMEQWREQAAKATRKYYALKKDMRELKRAAQGSQRYGHARAGSDELEVV